ncbi:MAG: HlyD family secretion protein [Alphaproteobacteria bacterium]|nr:MAG: HlyD family secretion protein [Alphaproteobacteria bacterium]
MNGLVQPQARWKRLRKLLFIILPVVVFALAVGGGWYWWDVLRFLQSTDDAYVQSDITLISPKVEGYIKEVRVADNQEVAEGSVLFVIDDRDFAAKLAQAEAAVAAEEAIIATYQNRLNLELLLSSESIALHRIILSEVTRFPVLGEVFWRAGPERQRVQIEAFLKSAIASGTLALADTRLAAEQNQLAVLRSQQREEEAKLQQANATLRLARHELEDTVIRAPVSGVAGNRAGQVGQYVKAGSQLLSLVPLSRVYVTANFKETQLTHMRPGQLAEVLVDAYPGLALEGRIESFAPASGAQFSLLPPDNATGNFTKIVQRVPVRIALPANNPLTGRLRPGLSVTVTIDTRNAGDGDGLVGAAQAKVP